MIDRRYALTLILVVLLATLSTAQNNWVGPFFGNWNNPLNWSNGLPGPSQDVVIYNTIDSVLLDTNPTVQSLTLGGVSDFNHYGSTLSDQGTRSLTMLQSLTVGETGRLGFSGGSSISAGADSLNMGSINLDNGSSLSVQGSFDNHGQISNYNFGGCILNVSGTFTNEQYGYLSLYNPGGVANLGTLVNNGFLYIGSGATLNVTTPSSITDVPANATYTINGTFNNGPQGPFASLTTVEGQVQIGNGQNIDISPVGGTLTMTGGLDFSGTPGMIHGT